MERTFFFLGFCPSSIRAVWRGFDVDSVLRKLFSGDLDFRKTETNFVFEFCPRGGGVWGGIRAGFSNFLAGAFLTKIDQKIIHSHTTNSLQGFSRFWYTNINYFFSRLR